MNTTKANGDHMRSIVYFSKQDFSQITTVNINSLNTHSSSQFNFIQTGNDVRRIRSTTTSIQRSHGKLINSICHC